MSSRLLAVFWLLLNLILSVTIAARAADPEPEDLGPELRGEVTAAIDVALKALRFRQQANGSWNDSLPATALAVAALAESHRRYSEEDGPFFRRALAYVAGQARPSGGFGDPPTVEGTALALLALRHSTTPSHTRLVAGAEAFLARVLADPAPPAAAAGDPRAQAWEALQAYGAPTVAAGPGVDRSWRRQLALRLLERRQDDGTWRSETSDPSPADHTLATLYAVLALERLYGG